MHSPARIATNCLVSQELEIYNGTLYVELEARLHIITNTLHPIRGFYFRNLPMLRRWEDCHKRKSLRTVFRAEKGFAAGSRRRTPDLSIQRSCLFADLLHTSRRGASWAKTRSSRKSCRKYRFKRENQNRLSFPWLPPSAAVFIINPNLIYECRRWWAQWGKLLPAVSWWWQAVFLSFRSAGGRRSSASNRVEWSKMPLWGFVSLVLQRYQYKV